jgi:uncharacterized membrane protein (UPF0127 family)
MIMAEDTHNQLFLKMAYLLKMQSIVEITATPIPIHICRSKALSSYPPESDKR